MTRIVFYLIIAAILNMQVGCWVSRRCSCYRFHSAGRACPTRQAGDMPHSSRTTRPGSESVRRSITDEGDILSEGTETEDDYRLPPVPTPPVPVEQQDI